MSTSLSELVKTQFREHFEQDPILVRAPGRINLIGEHTDYNNGFVLPAAVGQGIWFGVGKSGDSDQCSLISLDFDERFDFRISELKAQPVNSWQNYLLGVVNEVQRSGRKVEGFQLVFSGNVPKGSGMSSSAALECGTAFALNELFGLGISKIDMVKMSQLAEHTYAEVKCGIMDQFASMMGKQDHALLLDCQTLEFEYFPIQLNEHALLLCNSNVTHSLASSEYNVRRNQCDEGVDLIQKKYPDVSSLRDVSMTQLNLVKDQMEGKVYQRCAYVIGENERVHGFAAALAKSDLKTAGAILQKAQHAMRYEYEITCPEIDFMTDFANEHKSILGARMMGGGFGGCTINLIEKGAEDSFVEELNQGYSKKFGKEITPIRVDISHGVSLI